MELTGGSAGSLVLWIMPVTLHDAGLWAQISLNDVRALCHPNSLLKVWTETCTKLSCWRSLYPALDALLRAPHTKEQSCCRGWCPSSGPVLLTFCGNPSPGISSTVYAGRIGKPSFNSTVKRTLAAVKTEKSGMKDKESGSGLHYIILHPVKHTHNHFCILTKHTEISEVFFLWPGVL